MIDHLSSRIPPDLGSDGLIQPQVATERPSLASHALSLLMSLTLPAGSGDTRGHRCATEYDCYVKKKSAQSFPGSITHFPQPSNSVGCTALWSSFPGAPFGPAVYLLPTHCFLWGPLFSVTAPNPAPVVKNPLCQQCIPWSPLPVCSHWPP